MDKLLALRTEMKQKKMDYVLVLSADPHLSEYLPDCFKAREWLSGFTGSVGTLIVTQDFAGLWADSRYWVMAEKQLKHSGIELKKWHDAKTSYQTWLKENVQQNQVINVSCETVSLENSLILENIAQQKKATVNYTDLITPIWIDRKPLPNSPIYAHEAQFCAQTRQEKLTQVQGMIKEQSCDWLLISSLDDIAWLTNLRGSDVEYNPVFLAHCLVGLNELVLFVDEAKIPQVILSDLKEENIKIYPYQQVNSVLAEKIAPSESLMLDFKKVTVSTLTDLSKEVKKVDHLNPTTLLKSKKTDFEIEQIKQAMIQDGIALAQFFTWLENVLIQKETISELTVAEKLTEFRSKRQYYVSDSFGTIAGFNGNGAMPHYTATQDDFSYISGDGLLLIDSGGQYFNGTTDITRVVAIGHVTAEQKRDYTLVLKAHIALAKSAFPNKTPGQLLDSICRAPLWQAGLNYGHGTGHGVGYFLNVHEGPQVISYLSPIQAYSGLEKGNLLSNEPGLYRANQWGIRLENLIAVRECVTNEFGDFLCFETVTLCPFDQNCLEATLLTDEEIKWLNIYHQEVYQALSVHLDGAPLAWLAKQTQPI